MHDGEQLLGLPGPAPRFATVFRGYDRDQVDSWLREHERQVEGVAVPLGEMTRRERALEARFSELQPEATEAPSPTSLAAFVLGRAREIASELPQRMIREAEADRRVHEKTARELMETARARSAQIVGAAQLEHEEVTEMVEEARQQIDRFRGEATSAARERVQHQWEETTGAVTEVELELTGLRARRQIVRNELSQLRRSLEASRAQLRERGAHVEVVAHVDAAETRPESLTLMPIQW